MATDLRIHVDYIYLLIASVNVAVFFVLWTGLRFYRGERGHYLQFIRHIEDETALSMSVLDHIDQGVAWFDRAGRLLRYNARFSDMIRNAGYLSQGMTMREVVYHYFANLFPQMDALDLNDNVCAWLEHFHANDRWEERLPDNTVVLVKKWALSNGSYVLSLTDISNTLAHQEELSKAKEAAEQGHASKTAFLAAMSHEIRTPINGIIGTLGLLRETELDDEQSLWLSTALHSCEGLLQIVNDVLDFSKIEAGKMELEPTAFPIADLVDECSALMNVTAETKGLILSNNIEEGLPTHVIGDNGRIRQIVLNFLSNAIKFTDKGGVSLNVLGRGQDALGRQIIRFEVVDTGEGMTEDQLTLLFNEFTQVDTSYTRRNSGTGLGLAISRKLAEMMQGQIGVESVKNIGSTFWVDLPLSIAAFGGYTKQRTKKEESVMSSEAMFASKGRILLAEDNMTNQLVAATYLRKAGYHVDIVSNGKEAVQAVSSFPYDLVLMDVSMPEMDGMLATKRIRQLEGAKKDITIIAMTAHVLAEARQKCFESGMNDYVTKPIQKEKLLAIVAQKIQENEARIEENKPENIVKNEAKEEDIIDTHIIKQLSADLGEDMLPEVTKRFLSETENGFRSLSTIMESDDTDWQEAHRLAHSLGSAAHSFGLVGLSTSLRALETLCKAANDIGSSRQDFAGCAKLWRVSRQKLVDTLGVAV